MLIKGVGAKCLCVGMGEKKSKSAKRRVQGVCFSYVRALKNGVPYETWVWAAATGKMPLGDHYGRWGWLGLLIDTKSNREHV